MGLGGRIPPLLGVNDPRGIKEGRYLIAHAHEGTMKSGSPSAHWLTMGIGGPIPPLLGVEVARRHKEGRFRQTPRFVWYVQTAGPALLFEIRKSHDP